MLSTIIVFIFGLIVGASGFIGYHSFSGQDIKSPLATPSSITPTPTISFLLDRAPKNTLLANIVDMDGNVLWKSRTATEAAEIHKIQNVQQGEKIVTGEDGSVNLALGRYLRVALYSNTQLSLTQTLPGSIVFTQGIGKATYALESREQPVAVRIRRLLVRIKHGKVTIASEEDDSTITVQVSEGSAEVGYSDAQSESQRMILSSDETFTFDNDKQTGEIE